MNEPDTITYQLPPSATGEHHSYAELAPRDDGPFCHELAEADPYAIAPRPEQVGLALAGLVAANQLWENRGDWDRPDEHRTAPLYSYLLGMRPGKHNPLGGLRQNHKYRDKFAEVADVLRYPHGGAS